MSHYFILAIWASVFPFEPSADALFVEPVEAGQDNVLLSLFVDAHANGASLILI